jgi:integrase
VPLRGGSQTERRDNINKPKTIKTEDIEKILLHLDGQDKLIFRVSVESGLRIGDVLNLRAWYLEKIIYVQEKKTKKHRIITLSDDLHAKLKPIQARALKNNDKEAYAFPTKRRGSKKSIHRTTYHRHLKKICKMLNIDFSAHSTRKLFAQELLRKTGDIFEVQKQLNHKYIVDTCIYLDIDYQKMIKAATDPNVLQNFQEN